MADVRPFCALRPRDDLAGEIIAPPYDVLTLDEAMELARNRRNFVRITRSEVDLPTGADAHSQEAYDQARATLDAFKHGGLLVQDTDATYYFYGQVMGSHRQVGVLAACSVAEYDQGLIKKHEFTRPDKEDDRTHHMEVLDAQVGLVFLTYAATERLAQLTRQVTQAPPVWRVVTEDGVEHALWPAPLALVPELQAAFGELPCTYIADGHHRSAAASRLHAKRQDEASATFLAGLFPDDQLQVMAYNRVVHDLNGHTPDEFFAAVSAQLEVQPFDAEVPPERGSATMYFRGSWYLLRPRDGSVDRTDPTARLDVSWLQDQVLGPILGIDDPRRSTRISFVGGIRGAGALSKAVDEGAAVAFHLFPTGLDQLFEVADAGQVMPPKSTWFEPKLREGVVVRPL